MNTLKRIIASCVCCTLVLQPAFAVEQQYRIPVHELGVTPSSTDGNVDPLGGSSSGGSGLGDVTLDGSVSGPSIAFLPSTVKFNVTGTSGLVQSTFLVNKGDAAATLSGFNSNQNFAISSKCPSALPAGGSCSVDITRAANAPAGVTYDMNVLAPGSATAVLHLSTYAPAASATALALDQNTVNLGQVDKGVATSGSAVVTNVGSSTVNLQGIVSSDQFQITSDCPDNLLPGASCTIAATFIGYVSGTQTYQLLLRGSLDEDGTPLTFFATVLRNPVIAPSLGFSTDALVFDSVQVGSSAPKLLQLTNGGTAPAYLDLTKFASTPDFAIQHNCPSTLSAKTSCTLSIVYNASQPGATAAYSLIASAQDNLSATVLLQGQAGGGTSSGAGAAISVTPSLLQFGDVSLGQSAQLTSTLTNVSTAPISFSGFELNAPDGGFTATNDCTSPLQPGVSCSVAITFKPTAPANMSGSLGIVNTAGKTMLGFTGTGRAAVLALSRTSLSYGLAATTGARTLTVSIGNTGNVPLSGLSVVNSDPRLVIDASKCSSTLAPQASCDLLVTYTPASDGQFKTSFEVTSTNAGTKSVEVSGTVVELGISPSSIAFPDTIEGSYVDQDVTVTNQGQQALTLDGISIVTTSGGFAQSNNCGSVLSAGTSCTVAVRFAPSAEDHYAASLVLGAAGYSVGSVSLSGTGLPTRLDFSSTVLKFPATNVGKTSTPLSVIVTNPTNARVTFTGISVIADAQEFGQSNNCDQGLDMGASCTITAQWTPVSTAGQGGAIAVASSAGSYSISMSGTVTEPIPSFENDAGATDPLPAPVVTSDGTTHFSVAFLDTEVGATSATRTIKFNNKGTGPLAVQGVSIASGMTDFNQSNNCAEPIAPGSYCTISLVFKPSTVGSRTGSAVIVSDTGTYSFDLSGNGLGPQVQLYADSSSDFGKVLVGTTSLRKFIFQNMSANSAHNVKAVLTANAASLVENTCGTTDTPGTVAGGATCYVMVQYAPTTTGDLQATLAVSSDAANGTQSLTLNGSASQALAKLSANTSTDFGQVMLGASSSLVYTLSNVGDYDMTNISAAVTGAAGMSITSNNCGTSGQPGTLAPQKTCTVTVQFAPSAVGAVTGTLTATSSASNGAATLTLSGTGKYSTNNYALQFNGANGSTTISDTGTGSAWYSYNGASQTTQFYHEGTASLNLNGVNQAVYGPAISFNTDFTASAWVRPTGLPTSGAAIMGQWKQTVGQGAWLLSLRSNGTVWFSYAPYSEMVQMLSTPSALPLNQWSQVAITKSGSTFKLYVNGVVVASGTCATNATALAVPFAIGSYYTSGGTLGANNYFSGQIDDVRILNGSGNGTF